MLSHLERAHLRNSKRLTVQKDFAQDVVPLPEQHYKQTPRPESNFQFGDLEGVMAIVVHNLWPKRTRKKTLSQTSNVLCVRYVYNEF